MRQFIALLILLSVLPASVMAGRPRWRMVATNVTRVQTRTILTGTKTYTKTVPVWLPSTTTTIQTLKPFRGNVLRQEFRNVERMRRHLIEDHGYADWHVRGLDYDSLLLLHDMEHGEQLR